MTTNLLLLPPLSALTLCASRFNTLWKQSSDQGPQLTKSQTAYATSGQSWPAKHISTSQGDDHSHVHPRRCSRAAPKQLRAMLSSSFFPFHRLFQFSRCTSCKRSLSLLPIRETAPTETFSHWNDCPRRICLLFTKKHGVTTAHTRTHNQRPQSVFVCVRACADRQWCKAEEIMREEREGEQHTMTRTVE